MSQSRISQLLSNSRSRHQMVRSPELKKISGEWQTQKRLSYQSNQELRKMMREMHYLQSLNYKLTKGVSTKRKALDEAQQIRERHNQDLRKKHELHQLRIQQMLKNRSLANRIKQDRLKKIHAVKQNFFEKESLASYYRQEGRKLRELKDENFSTEFNKNRSRVEQIIEFQCNLRQSAIRKKEEDNMSHIRAYRDFIQKQKEKLKLNERKSFEIKKRMKALTQSSSRKLSKISNISVNLEKYKSPYGLSLKNKNLLKRRSETQKNYTETGRDISSVYLSQYQQYD